jgi:transposase
MERLPYPTDLTDTSWHVIAPLLPKAGHPGRPRKYAWRDILDAIVYVLRTGCQWRCLPHDLPKWKTAYHYLWRWRKGGTWTRIHAQRTAQVVQPPPRRVLVAASVEPAPRPAFTVLPRRWAVERSFAWLGQNHRLSKDYERLCQTSETMVYAAMSRLMTRRLAAA